MVREVVESGRPLAYIQTAEEQRLSAVLQEIGMGPVWSWSSTEGLRDEAGERQAGADSAREALDFIADYSGAAIFHLKDFHEPLKHSAEVRRRIRDVYYQSIGTAKFIAISSPVRFIPEELERSIVFLQLRTPDLLEITEYLRKETSGALSDAVLDQLAPALLGLTLEESHYAVERARAGGRQLGEDSVPALLQEKQLLINRTGVLEYVADGKELDEIGGLEGLKQWLTERRKLFNLREGLKAEIVPKGVLLMGIPGCGKSLCVKAIASSFQLPLYRMDMIEIFSGRHGKPEGAFVQACRMMEDIAPAVLWFDEIEMGITSTESSGEQGRIFAFFLTWMQEKTSGLFVAATANRIDLLPAEMIRKGRFDEVFFVDLPLDAEQAEIFWIHLKRRGVSLSGLNIPQLTKLTGGWTGAEIEQCVVSALTRARLKDREVEQNDLIDVAAKFVPLSRTMKEQISKIRSWAFERAIRASPLPRR